MFVSYEAGCVGESVELAMLVLPRAGLVSTYRTLFRLLFRMLRTVHHASMDRCNTICMLINYFKSRSQKNTALLSLSPQVSPSHDQGLRYCNLTAPRSSHEVPLDRVDQIWL